MEKTCKNESSPSRDWVYLYQERFPYHPQLSLWRGAEKALVTTGFFWAGQVFLPLTMLGDWYSLVHWCPSSSMLSLWASLLPLPRETARWQTQMTLSLPDSASVIRPFTEGSWGDADCSMFRRLLMHFFALHHFRCDEHHSKVGTVMSF